MTTSSYGIVGADLTGKQTVFFDFLTRFMLSFPRTMGRTATLKDMIAITADIGPYQSAIAQLPEVPRTFFERDFNSATFKQTREQVRYRLMLGDEKLERLFGERTALDLGQALDEGAVILVSTRRSSTLGRIRTSSGACSFSSSCKRSSPAHRFRMATPPGAPHHRRGPRVLRQKHRQPPHAGAQVPRACSRTSS